MNATRFKMEIAVPACLIAIGVAGIANARPTYGGTCTGCHSNTDKLPSAMNWSPTNFTLPRGATGSVTFNVTDLGVSATGANPRYAIALQGLEDALLDASIAAGGNWTLFSESHGTSYNSDVVAALGLVPPYAPYVLNFTIGSNAANGAYPIGVSLATSGGGGSALRTGFNTTPGFTITIIPEPATLTMLLTVLGFASGTWRRRRVDT